jgi:Helicase conserved C-terminal domain
LKAKLNNTFRHWANNGRKALRLVMDEAHQIITEAEFRPQFLKIRELAEFKAQLIYLTASLPKRLEAQFLIQTCLPPDTIIIRAPCDQPQISYIKLTFNSMNTDRIRLAVDVANIMTEIMGPDRKGIFFCSTIEEADILGAKYTSNCVSHSKLPYGIKAENEAKWKSGQSPWIAATTGMICGIDDSNVGVIIFVGLGYGLVNLYQGAGRSGRDGTPSWTIVLQSSNTYMAIPPKGLNDDPQCIQESDEWLLAEECRRIGFSSLFDKARVSCSDLLDAHFCDFCKPDLELIVTLRSKIPDPPVFDPPEEDNFNNFNCDLMNMDFDGILELSATAITPPTPYLLPTSLQHSSSIILSHNSTSHSSFHQPTPSSSDPFFLAPTPGVASMQIERQVAFYKATKATKAEKSKILNAFTTMLLGKCPLCWAYQGILVDRHNKFQWIQCRGPTVKGFMELGFDRPFKRRIKYPAYTFCWKCHLPQGDFLPPSHPKMDSGPKGLKNCPHEDFVTFLVLFIRRDAEWWKRACRAFGIVSNISEADLVKWYTAEDVQGGFNNSLELIIWFYIEKEKERKTQ